MLSDKIKAILQAKSLNHLTSQDNEKKDCSRQLENEHYCS